MGPMNMTVESFQQHLRAIDPGLKVWWNPEAHFWQVYRDLKRLKLAYVGEGIALWVPSGEKDLVATAMDKDLKANPLDLRLIWSLVVGDMKSPNRKYYEWLHKNHWLHDKNGDVTRFMRN